MVLSWMVQTLLLLAAVLLPWALGAYALEEAGRFVPTVFTVAALTTMFAALRRREPVGAGSLNRWDQATAFNFVAVALHLIQHLAP